MGANPNITDKYGSSPILLAARKNDFKAIELLKKYGANPNIQNNSKDSVLHRLLNKHNDKLVKNLLKGGAAPNLADISGNTPLHRAVHLDNNEIADTLIGHDADLNIPNKSGKTPIHLALEKGNFKLTIKMLQGPKYIDINAQDKHLDTYLHYAARKRDGDLVKMLLAKGADPGVANALGQTPADLAKEQGDIDTAIQILIWAESRGKSAP